MFNDNKIVRALLVIATTALALNAEARPNVTSKPKVSGGQQKTTAGTCKPAEANIDLDINNIRARLMTGGDMWWDIGTSEARYEVPKGSKKNSLFAGSVWIGGLDPQGQLKVAAQTYRQDGNDYWPGPLDAQGNVAESDCSDWDRFWKINKSDILKFRDLQDKSYGAIAKDAAYQTIVEWPAKGNPYAVGSTSNNLNLANADRTYAPFIDVDKNGLYDFSQGDYPEILGDQFIWWVFNDKGNTKQQSQTEGIGMEVQASAFGFASKDFLNDATFYKYRLINRSNLYLDSTYLATWTDADLGYYADDYIGCDTSRGLGILYNGKSQDGNGQVNSYGTKIPMVGIDFFQGPEKPYDSAGFRVTKRLGMESFTYYNNDNTNTLGNPDNGQQIYFYMTGSIRNGQRFSYDFNGPNVPSKAYGTPTTTRFVFTGDPGTPSEWSECTCNNPVGDRRFIHSSGPFKLESGVANEIIIGAVWVADAGGCPTTSFKKIRVADDQAQSLFDNGFKTIEGPEAPRLVVRELDRKLIFYMLNDPASNNYKEQYGYIDSPKYRVSSIKAAKYVKAADSLYKFEGYRVFQLKNSTVTPAQIFTENGTINTELASEVFSCDIKNGVTKIVNFSKDIEVSDSTYKAVVKVNGLDSGIKHSFFVSNDQFSTRDEKRLVNYRNYYFVAIAYAYNNFSKGFNPSRADSTQDAAYIESSHGAGGTPISVVTAMPNPANGDMGTVLGADYGDGVVIKRLEGSGNGGNELQLSKESENNALLNTVDINPTYLQGKAPVSVKVIDPLKIVPGNWELYIDGKPQAEPGLGVERGAYWKLVNTASKEEVLAERPIDIYNEQIIEKYGLSIAIQQVTRPGDDQDGANGLIGSSITYVDSGLQWLAGVNDGEQRSPLNWIRSGRNEDTTNPCGNPGVYNDRRGPGFDTSKQVYEGLLPQSVNTKGTWAPYVLGADADSDLCGFGVIKKNSYDQGLYSIPSIDVVFTSDKSKWTRCVVFETCDAIALSENNTRKFDLRGHKSWDGETDASGRPVYSSGSVGMSWFPGYAINQETGERLNIAFGEDSWLRQYNGRDMIWNPTSDLFSSLGDILYGGKHYVYVFASRYDSCKSFLAAYNNGGIPKSNAYRGIQWVGTPMLARGSELKTIKDGIIPTETRLKFRVTRPYIKFISELEPGYTDSNKLKNHGNPLYSFSTDGLVPKSVAQQSDEAKKKLLDRIHAVPNPYYSYSGYEGNRLDSRVRIINLPKRATISIYSIDGSLIRKLSKDNAAVSYIDWDIKNEKGLPIASGMYLMHINAEGIGETIVKWFGAMRPLDITNY